MSESGSDRAQNTFWLQGLFWTNSTKSSPLRVYFAMDKNFSKIFQRGYFVKFGSESPLAPLFYMHESWKVKRKEKPLLIRPLCQKRLSIPERLSFCVFDFFPPKKNI